MIYYLFFFETQKSVIFEFKRIIPRETYLFLTNLLQGPLTVSALYPSLEPNFFLPEPGFLWNDARHYETV